jgi:hypothetical protein
MTHVSLVRDRRRFAVQLTLLFALFAFASAAAQAQATRIRGQITGVKGDMLSVKTREGKDIQIKLSEQTAVAASKALKLEDLKPGDYVGTTTEKRADGELVAVEVHILPKTAKPGHTPWDLKPGSMMTNGNIAPAASVVKSAGGQQLKIDYEGGSQTVVVPPGTPIVTSVPADRSYLKPGEYIFTTATAGPDGVLTTQRIQVSHDGVRPPQ